MKILFISPGIRPDYQCDMVFHGLRALYGDSVIDYPRLDYMYSGYIDLHSLYGHGFTLYGLLPEIPIDRTNIPERIHSKEFDLVIYGSVCRDVTYMDLVTQRYPKNKILFIDGEDQPTLLYELSRHGVYFKRELAEPHPGIYPIHFAIPTSKIGALRHIPKTKVRAFLDPRDKSTYVYTSELAYYSDYATSLFAFTMRKGGWDCLRHYEIMANRCIPLFLDLEECPETTLMQLPKTILQEAMTYMDRDGEYWSTEEGHNLWTSLWRRLHLPFVCHSTTERLAQYVLETSQSV